MENRSRKTMAVGVALAALLLFVWAVIGAVIPPVSQDEPVKATGDVKPPKIVNQVQPVYPEDAKKQGIEGTVILEATADIKGKVQEVKVLRGVEGLNQAAVDAVKQWTYEPMMIDGKPKPVVFTVTVQFKLDDKGAKRAGEGQEPKIVKKVDPVYPEGARKQGLEGDVIIEAMVDEAGKVKEAKVLRGVDGLNQAALDAVKQWLYEPAVVDGKPKAVRFTVTIRFKLA
ncbi:MAG TPA: energy transducer TonB [Candidatus Aminicenantes bacterium]|nr:energy transducer TonB [Candidatus Aminicenantes bacterium]HRY65933.1 energy transducer TonB [Candidatus Aminicenantes bacterium]HRZ72741.1 energy transducer TonB [Candidatus Aminicenantes bacterium]